MQTRMFRITKISHATHIIVVSCVLLVIPRECAAQFLKICALPRDSPEYSSYKISYDCETPNIVYRAFWSDHAESMPYALRMCNGDAQCKAVLFRRSDGRFWALSHFRFQVSGARYPRVRLPLNHSSLVKSVEKCSTWAFAQKVKWNSASVDKIHVLKPLSLIPVANNTIQQVIGSDENAPLNGRGYNPSKSS